MAMDRAHASVGLVQTIRSQTGSIVQNLLALLGSYR